MKIPQQANGEPVPPPDQISDLQVARQLAEAGIPVLVCHPDPDGRTQSGRATGYILPSGWQTMAASPSYLNAWRPGMALIAVMGHGLDLVDVDPRNGGDLADVDGITPRTRAVASTPSGGTHLFVSSMAVRSRDDLMPGIDVKAGTGGQGVGFAFIAPTVRKSKATGQPARYRWTEPPDLDGLREDADEASGSRLAALIRKAAGKNAGSPRLPEGSRWVQLKDHVEVFAGDRGHSDGWTDPDIARLIREGVPAGTAQQPVLRDVVARLVGQGYDRTVCRGIWQAIVDRTELTNPSWPWSEADFTDMYESAARKFGDPAKRKNMMPAEDDEPPELLPEIPAFPVAMITGPLRSFIEWGVKDGLHAECVAAAGLSALVTLTGPARLRIGDAKTVRAILWIALVGVASSGKSPAYERAFEPIRAAYAAERGQWEQVSASWRDQAATVGRKDAGPAPERPEPVEMDDVTTEALARWLVKRAPDSSGAVVDDELAAFLDGLNQYKGGQGADLSRWLKLWTGAPLHVQRVGKGGSENDISLYVAEPVVSVSGPIVPENLHLLGKPGSGFRPRWLPFYAPSRPPAWHGAGDYPGSWKQALAELLSNRSPRDWTLSAAAMSAWLAARERWHAQQSEAEPDDVIEALRKADTQCLRIALVVAESSAPGAGGEIPLGAMQSAIAIVDYCIAVWRSIPASSTMTTSRREDVMDAAYRRLLAWLESRPAGTEGLPEGSKPRPRASKRELQRWLHESPQKVAELIGEHGMRHRGGVVQTVRGGQTTIWIYAPERGGAYKRKVSRATPSDSGVHPHQNHETAGQRDDEPELKVSRPTVATASRDTFGAVFGADNPTADNPTADNPTGRNPDNPGYLDAPEASQKIQSGDTRRNPDNPGYLDVLEPFQAAPVRLVRTAEGLDTAIAAVTAAGIAGLDTETTGLDPLRADVRLVQLAIPGQAFVLDCRALSGWQQAVQQVVSRCPVLVIQNGAFDLRFLLSSGVRLPEDLGSRVWDTMLAGQLLAAGDRGAANSLEALAGRYLGAALDKSLQNSGWDGELSQEQLRYAALDAAVLLPLQAKLAGEITSAGLDRAMQIEHRCLPAMVWMMASGAPFDSAAHAALQAETEEDVRNLHGLLDRMTVELGAEPVNYGSPAQVKKLFAGLGTDLEGTDAETLQKTDHPLSRLLLRYREATKLQSTYGRPYADAVAPDGRIHAQFKQLGSQDHGVVTGRMSCASPNLQQVPRAGGFRALFRAPEGRKLIDADYSQIQLRIAAEISGDSELLAAYGRGDDLHELTARKVLGQAEVSREARQAAKALNFGLLFGMGARRLRDYAEAQYGVIMTPEQAAEYHGKFFSTYRGLKRWHRRQPDGVIETRTLAGRRRVGVTRFTDKLNTPVQGSEADGLKLALAALFERRQRAPGGTFPVLALHDEIAVECPSESAEEARAWLVTAMEDGMQQILKTVPVVVDSSISDTWDKP